MVRTSVISALILGLVAGCGSKKSDDEKTPDPTPGPAKPDVTALRKAIQALPPIDVRRVPIRDTPQASKNPRAADYYKPAQQKALKALGQVKPEELLSYAERWAAAPEPMRKLAATKDAIDAANEVLVGAGAPTGASPVKDGESVEPYVALGAVSIASSLEDAAVDKPKNAAWQLLGVVRMGQDLTRLTTIERVDPAATIIRAALAALRQVTATADRKKLGSDDLTALLGACRVVAASHPSYPALYTADLNRRAQNIESGHDTSDAARITKLVKDAELLAALSKPEPKRASQKQELLHKHKKDVWGADAKDVPVGIDVDRYGRWLAAWADTHGTCLVMALELDRRTRKKNALAPKLEDLTPKPLETPILDPLGARPWEYVDDGFGGRVLRSAPIFEGDGTTAVEMRIMKRGKK